MPVFMLSKALQFPSPNLARKDGLLAVGGDLSAERLLKAYSLGIFPWYSPGEPILWWSPDPRFVLYPDELKISKSMGQVMRNAGFRITMDTAFPSVIHEAATIRRNGQPGTWITPEMEDAYIRLHDLGYAHSLEVWKDEELAGGLYGLSLGRCFFGESMFSHISNASKAGFIHLVQQLAGLDFHLVDCQVHTYHLESLGARHIPRTQFMSEIENALKTETLLGKWPCW
jgi:leucyl/phenylalanyl-tRNA--protein transferase